jgi:hypothetical protein
MSSTFNLCLPICNDTQDQAVPEQGQGRASGNTHIHTHTHIFKEWRKAVEYLSSRCSLGTWMSMLAGAAAPK